jgi:crossover junction endodeoxyribonuclease RuvC
VTRILGIDPGLTRCGVGIIDLGRARRVSLVHVGVLLSPKENQLDARIGSIGLEIEALIKKYKP